MNYYASNYYATNHYGSDYYGPDGEVAPTITIFRNILVPVLQEVYDEVLDNDKCC
jgi:hypothetical protein